MHSFVIPAAVCLLLTLNVSAHVPHSFRELAVRNTEPGPETGVLGWLGHLFKRNVNRRQTDATCYQDEYYNFVFNSTFGEVICQAIMTYPNSTTTIDYTPVSTVTIVTTSTETDGAIYRSTPLTTVTVTVSNTAVAKRDAQITPMPRAASDMKLREVFSLYRRQAAAANNTVPDDNTLSASLSSACSCQTYAGSVVTETYTNEAALTTRYGFDRTTVTSTETRIARALTATVTVVAIPSTTAATSSVSGVILSTAPAVESSFFVQTTGVSQGTPSFPSDFTPEPTDAPSSSSSALLGTPATSSTSSVEATPTAPLFTCPDDNGDMISQMINNERYDYTVFCDADLISDSDVASDSNLLTGLSYNTFPECVAACSTIDAGFDLPLCKGVVYYDTANGNGDNCVLKSTAGNTTFALGVNVAILQRIAVGIDAADPSGTGTESVPFSGPTTTFASSEMSTMMSSIMGNSTSTMPMITPAPVISGRPAVDGITYYSTFVSAGSTFSTGSVFSTYFSANGSWYYSYYSTYSQAWTSATTYYGGSETSTVIAGTNSSSTTLEGAQGGNYTEVTTTTTDSISNEYPLTKHNVTEVIGSVTYNASGTEIYATTTTIYSSYTETAVSSNNGSSNGGEGGSGAGNGGSGSGVVSVSAITSTSTSFFSTQTVIINSGATSGGSGGGASGFESSGAIQTPVPTITSTGYFSTQSVIIISGATQGGSGYAGSGSVQSTAVPVIGGSSVVINTYGTAYGSGYAASGVNSVNGTSGATSTAASGMITPGFSNSQAPRSGTDSTTIPVETLESVSVITIPGPISVTTNSYGTAYGSGYAISGSVTGAISANATSGAVSGSGAGFTNSGAPRSGTQSLSVTIPFGTGSLTVPAPYGPYTPLTSTPSESPSVSSNVTLPVPTGTGSIPLSTGTSPGFSNSGDNRSGTYSGPSGTAPIPMSTGLVGTGTAPIMLSTGTAPIMFSTGTAPIMLSTGTAPATLSTASQGFSNSGDNRSGTYSAGTSPGTAPMSMGTGSVPLSTGTAPIMLSTGTAPIMLSTGTAPIMLSTGTAPIMLSTGTAPILLSTGTAPMMLSTGTAPVPTSNMGSFSNSGAPRSGTLSSGTPLPTSPSSSTCIYDSAPTTTVFITTTLYGCYGNCAPGGYGGPESFGPPVFGAPPGLISPATTTL